MHAIRVAATDLPVGHLRQVVAGDLDCGRKSRRVRIELAQLQLNALAERARSDAGRVQVLHAGEDGFDFGGAAFDLRFERVRDLIERLGEIAVVADGIDDRAGDRKLLRAQPRKLQLPQQMLLQGLSGRVGEFLLPVIIVAVPGGIGRSDAVLAPALIENLPGLLGGGARAARFPPAADSASTLALASVSSSASSMTLLSSSSRMWA